MTWTDALREEPKGHLLPFGHLVVWSFGHSFDDLLISVRGTSRPYGQVALVSELPG